MSETADKKKRLLKAKIAVALQDELGRVPKVEEIEEVFLLTRVMYKAVLAGCGKRFLEVLSDRAIARCDKSTHVNATE